LRTDRRWPVATSLLALAALLAVLAGPSLPALPAANSSDAVAVAGSEASATWAAAVSEDWPADAVIYHVFVDRFADGDAADQQVAGTADDPGYADALTDWMGGDLAGVRARLDHIVATGANTIWLSPVTSGPFFHGYHPTDLTEVDERFGDVDQLRGLVDDAHARGLKVVYDLVLNHTSDAHAWFVEAQADCTGSQRVDWYRFSDCPDRYDAFAGLPELPQLDLDHPPARDWVFDEVLPFWLDHIGVDGFRLDHVAGPSRDLWAALDAEVTARWPGTLLLAEVWAPQTSIDSYAPVMTAATAFPLRDRLEAVFARGGDVRAIAQPVAARSAAPRQLRDATYLSSHDQSRFTHLTGGDRKATALAYAAILTMPGLPVIYYGDEVGLAQTSSLADGADFADRWFREPMPWDEAAWDTELFDRVAALARLRTITPALHAGDYLEVLGEGELWVFERRHEDGRVLVVINTGDATATLDLVALGVVGDEADTEVRVTDLVRELRAEGFGGSETESDGRAGAALPEGAQLQREVPARDVLVLGIELAEEAEGE
jgi:glycosidase